MTQPNTSAPTLSDLGASIVRTFVALAVGTVVAYLARRWHVVLDAGTSDGLVQAFTATVIGVYYVVARLLESKWRGFGFLLGLTRQPKYVAKALDPGHHR
jgi:hypothetical protein